MTIEVEGPDGVILEFPDGTSREDMKRAMEKRYPPKPPPRRSDFERLGQNFIDGLNRGPVLSTWRNRMANPDAPRTMFENILRAAPGGQFDYAAQLSMLTPAQRQTLATQVGQPAVEAERARRAEYERVSAADPFYNSGNVVNAGVMTLLGQLSGAAADPTSWIGGGASFGARVATSAATNAGFDFIAQDADTQSGVQDEYNVGQTALAAVLGGTLEGVREVPGFLSRAFTDPPPARPQAPPPPPPDHVVRPEVPEGARIIEETPAGTIWETADGAIEGEVNAAAVETPANTIRAYHGSSAKDLQVLNPSERGALGPGVYLTPDRNLAGRYGENTYEVDVADIFDGSASVGSRGSDVNVFAAWRDQTAKLVSAADPADAPAIQAIVEGLAAGDGYPLYTRLVQHYKSEEKATDLFRRAGFKGISGIADGEEIVMFDAVSLQPAPAAPAGVGGPPPPPTRGFTPKQPPPPPPGGLGGAGPAGPAGPQPLDFVQPVKPTGTLRRIKAKIDEKGIPGAVADFIDSLYTDIISEQHPLVNAVERLRSGIEAATGKPMDIAPGSDPRKLARGAYDVRAIAMQDIMHGVHGYHKLNPETAGIADVIAAVHAAGQKAGTGDEAALKALNDYLTARRGIEEWKRRERGELDNDPLPADRGGDRASLEAHVAAAEAANPEIAALADQVNNYALAMWKKAHDAGLVDADSYQAALDARNFYVPFRRVMDESASVAGSGKAGKGSVAKKFKGSDRDVVGPLETLIRQTFEINSRIRQNDINLSLVRMAESLDRAVKATDPNASNGLLKKLPTPSKPIRLSPDEIKALGSDAQFGDEAATLYRPGEISDGGKAVLYVWRDGKREAWEITDAETGKDLFNAITGMSNEQTELLVEIFKVPAAVLRAGITTNPEFILTNFVRDQMSAWILTDVGFKPGEGAKGMVDELTGADVGRLYNLAGGLSGGANAASVREAADKFDVMALAQRGIRAKYFKNFESFLQLTEVSETGTRLRLFELAFKRAKKEGMNDYDALIEASYTARDYLDFGRNGSKMAGARKVITFLNATLQGLDKTIRASIGDAAAANGRYGLTQILRPLFQMDPSAPMRAEDVKALKLAGKVWAKVAALGVFGLSLAALYADDEEYQQIPEYTRNTNWVVKIGGGQWAKIPKPFELAIVSNILERAYEAAHFGDPAALEKLVAGVFQTLAPPDSNPLLGTITDLRTNTNAMTGGKIVPESKLTLLPQDQYNAWTSEFGIAVGKALGVSPAMVDHAVTGFAGSWGAWMLRFSNLTDPDRPAGGAVDWPMSRRFITDFQRGAQDKTTFFDRVGGRTSELARQFNSINERLESGRPGEASAILNAADEPGRYWLMLKLAGKEDGGASITRIHPLSRASAVNLEITRMTDELYGGRVKDKGLPLPVLSPDEKGMVQDALERLGVAEIRNAMIATRQPGFENRAMMDRQSYIDELEHIAPGLYDELERRLSSGRDRAYSYDAVMALWPQVEARLKQEGSGAYLGDLADEAADRSAE